MQNKLNIKAWPEEDRPREKLLDKGKETLSNAELIAILIGSGNRDESAVGLSQKILQSVENNLNKLGKLNIADLIHFKGIGEAKAITIAAALELGRRRTLSEPAKLKTITCSKDAFNIMDSYLSDLPNEEFWILLLNRANKVTHKIKISVGGLEATVVDIRVILKTAINNLASGIILFHNHPSGNLKPSKRDQDITEKIKKATKIMDIILLDHIVVANGQYYSFADNKIL